MRPNIGMHGSSSKIIFINEIEGGITFIFFCIKKEINQPNLAKTPRAVAPRRQCQPGRNEKQ